MKLERLFHVLVVLGGASAGGGCEADPEPERRDPNPDAAPSTDDGGRGDATGEELAPCFCNESACCDRTGEPAILAEGFECCWSTTCP